MQLLYIFYKHSPLPPIGARFPTAAARRPVSKNMWSAGHGCSKAPHFSHNFFSFSSLFCCSIFSFGSVPPSLLNTSISSNFSLSSLSETACLSFLYIYYLTCNRYMEDLGYLDHLMPLPNQLTSCLIHGIVKQKIVVY